MIKNKLSVYRYHDYRRYFEDLLRINISSGLTLRKLAHDLKISPSYLSQVISGKKDFSADIIKNFKKVLRLDKNEMQHLLELLSFSRSENQKQKIEIYDKIVKDKKYQKNNPNESEVYSYLSHWYFVAIKEFLSIESNVNNVNALKENFIYKIKSSEVRRAIKFLVNEKFIQINEDSTITILKQQVDCYSDVYRLSLSSFHKQMFNLAIEAIHLTARDERLILGNTVSLSEEGCVKVKEVIENAHRQIAEIEKNDRNKSVVYHAGLAFFPITKRRKI